MRRRFDASTNSRSVPPGRNSPPTTSPSAWSSWSRAAAVSRVTPYRSDTSPGVTGPFDAIHRRITDRSGAGTSNRAYSSAYSPAIHRCSPPTSATFARPSATNASASTRQSDPARSRSSDADRSPRWASASASSSGERGLDFSAIRWSTASSPLTARRSISPRISSGRISVDSVSRSMASSCVRHSARGWSPPYSIAPVNSNISDEANGDGISVLVRRTAMSPAAMARATLCTSGMRRMSSHASRYVSSSTGKSPNRFTTCMRSCDRIRSSHSGVRRSGPRRGSSRARAAFSRNNAPKIGEI